MLGDNGDNLITHNDIVNNICGSIESDLEWHVLWPPACRRCTTPVQLLWGFDSNSKMPILKFGE